MRKRDWKNLIKLNAIEEGDVTNVKLGTKDLAVYDAKAGIFVSMSRCTHGAANLCDGYFDGTYICLLYTSDAADE